MAKRHKRPGDTSSQGLSQGRETCPGLPGLPLMLAALACLVFLYLGTFYPGSEGRRWSLWGGPISAITETFYTVEYIPSEVYPFPRFTYIPVGAKTFIKPEGSEELFLIR